MNDMVEGKQRAWIKYPIAYSAGDSAICYVRVVLRVKYSLHSLWLLHE